MPPKIDPRRLLELTPAQREAYDLAEKEGVVRLNALGETITVQHVFELVMRLKQICNFDPLTGQSAKLEQLQADMAEVAESGRKAIVFSQWVEPLEIAGRGAGSRSGRCSTTARCRRRSGRRSWINSRRDRTKHVLLMSYGTGSVGLNLQFTNYVFLFDRWWNPAVEDQAINRAHRLGQKEPVFVTRFVDARGPSRPHRRGVGEKTGAIQRTDRPERPAAVAGHDGGGDIRPVRDGLARPQTPRRHEDRRAILNRRSRCCRGLAESCIRRSFQEHARPFFASGQFARIGLAFGFPFGEDVFRELGRRVLEKSTCKIGSERARNNTPFQGSTVRRRNRRDAGQRRSRTLMIYFP